MTHDKPLVLVDGSAYLFRAYHALPPLSTSKGYPTGATYGVISMLRKLMKDYPASPVAVVFDAKGKSFRNDIYPEYKATRAPMPDDLRDQVQPIRDIILAMGLPLVVVDAVEADDVIGTLAREATEGRRKVVVSTSDKDMAQLVSEHVTLVNTMFDTRLDREGVVERFGVPPERIVDLLALMGDSIDNIPGVPKVGPKTAAKWLNEYGSLEGVIAHANDIKGKVGDNLRATVSVLPISKQLTTIDCHVKLPFGIDDLVPKLPDLPRLRELFEQFEFRAWLDELVPDGEALAAAQQIDAQYETIWSAEALTAWLARASETSELALHVQAGRATSYMDAEIVGVALSHEPGEAIYLALAHDYPGAPDQLARGAALPLLKPVLENAGSKKVGHDLKLAKNVLARYEIELAGITADTMLESYVLDSIASRHTLDDLAQRHLGFRTLRYEDVAGKGAKQLAFGDVPVDRATEYAAQRADMALRVNRSLRAKLEAAPSLDAVFTTIEMPLLSVLSRMELAGALVDARRLAQQSRELADRMKALSEDAWRIAGEPFNLDSPKQLQGILYEKLGLPRPRKTPSGQLSTAEDVLQELALDHELPRIILEYRSLAKLKGTYTDALPLQINRRTGRVHTCYHQAVAATGRLSSSDPNLQNIPIRTPEGRRIRQAFVAPPGKLLVAADYSQIELRIMAHLSGDEGLKRAFALGLDVHRATAADVFGVDLERVTHDQRRSAKTINFGLIYGMSAFGLSQQLGVSRLVAQQYIERYFERYPGVRDYMERVRAKARTDGYVETVFGRRLYLPEINQRNMARRQAAERTAINAPMQGSAADIIKRAMIDVDGWLAGAEVDARMIMQVHDELLFEVARSDAEALARGIVQRMTHAADLTVPLVVDVGRGENWDEAH